ncbi:MAG: Smr/MutS family protein [Crocinitomicaceae bacterium]|jgi:dsDNA-specific endonuclease/ATPase MutS2|tara:strand:- start:17509 stop:18027 length:519 start_codon:yes stop_codon:yes gene_type:complete
MFLLGEYISILNETGKYRVLSIQSSFLLVEDEHGFERKIVHGNAVKIASFNTGEIQVKDADSIKIRSNKKKVECIPEIDLHLESFELINDSNSAHKNFLLQINTFKRFINNNLKKKVSRVLVIHGVGNGKLKSEIKSCLQGRPGYEMNDANFSQRGVGASYIDIKTSKAEPL